MNPEVYLFTGPNGVGKSTLIRSIIEREPRHFTHVQGSSVLKQYLGVTTYEELAQFDHDYKNEVAEIAMASIIKRARKDRESPSLLIDAHMLFFDNGNVTSTTTEWYSSVDSIVSVSTDPSIAYDRILSDSASNIRERSILPQAAYNDSQLAIALLSGYMEMSRRYADGFCSEKTIDSLKIDNSGHIDESVDTFLRHVESRR